MGLGWVDKILHSLVHSPHWEPIIPVVAVHALSPRIEVQEPSVDGRAPRSRPVVAVRAYVVHGRIFAVPGGGKKHRVSVNL